MKKKQSLSFEQKKQIERMILDGKSKKDIASFLKVHPSTIYREITRGLTTGDEYKAEISNKKTLYSNQKKGKRPFFKVNVDCANYVSKLILKEKLSIIEIKEKCKQEGLDCPSRTTIYQAIDAGLIPNVTRLNLFSNTTTIFSNGLIQIPKHIRSELKIRDGDIVNITLKKNQIVIQKLDKLS